MYRPSPNSGVSQGRGMSMNQGGELTQSNASGSSSQRTISHAAGLRGESPRHSNRSGGSANVPVHSLGVAQKIAAWPPANSFADKTLDARRMEQDFEVFNSAATFDDSRRKEKELEAERLWWSEASERQMKELECSFDQQFEKTAARLRADIESSQDKLEVRLESERSQRHAALADLRRELDAQKVMLTEVVRQLEASLRNRASDKEGASLEDKTHYVNFSMEAQQRAENERQKDLQLSGLEAAVADLRREFSNLDGRSSVASQVQAGVEASKEAAASVEALRQEVAGLRDKTDLQAQSLQEMHTLHQVITQSMGEVTRGLEEVSGTACASERNLKQRLEEVSVESEASSRRLFAEAIDALELSGKRLAQSVVDEQERRTTEANVLRARLDSICSQFEDLQASLEKKFKALRLPVADPPPSEPAVTPAEVVSLRASQEVACGELVQLQRKIAELVEQGPKEAGAHLQEGMAQLEERIVRQLAEGLAGERSWCAEQLAGLWRHADEVALSKDTTASQPRPPAEMAARADMTGCQDVHTLRAELDGLKEAVQSLRRESNLEASSVPFLKSAGLALGTRVDLLQEQLRSRASSDAARLDALDAKVQQVARASDVRRLEEELQRLDQELQPLTRRVETSEAESRKAARELRPLAARCEAAESELQRLARDSMPLGVELRSLQLEFQAMKAGQLSATTTTGTSFQDSAAPTPHQQPQQQAEKEDAVPALSDELTTSLGNLLQRVHETLTSSTHGKETRGSSAVIPTVPGPSLPDGAVDGEAMMQALRAVQELRQRNSALRQENADLVEELMFEQQAQQSVCTTPNDTLGRSAQFVFPRAKAAAAPQPPSTGCPADGYPAQPGAVAAAAAAANLAAALQKGGGEAGMPGTPPPPVSVAAATLGAPAPMAQVLGPTVSPFLQAGASPPARTLAGSVNMPRTSTGGLNTARQGGGSPNFQKPAGGSTAAPRAPGAAGAGQGGASMGVPSAPGPGGAGTGLHPNARPVASQPAAQQPRKSLSPRRAPVVQGQLPRPGFVSPQTGRSERLWAP